MERYWNHSSPLSVPHFREPICSNFSNRIARTTAFYTTQSCAPPQRHESCPGKRGKAAAAPAPASITDLAYDERHSSHRGTRLALVSRLSQKRHPEGNNTLTTASLISPSQLRPCRNQPRTRPRRAGATPMDDPPPPTTVPIYSFFALIKERMHVAVIEASRSPGSGGRSGRGVFFFLYSHCSNPFSLFFLQSIHFFAHPTASPRFFCNSSSQFAHTPSA